MPGWEKCTEEIREFNDLPENAKRYIWKVENYLEIPGNTLGFSVLLIRIK